MAIAMNFTKDQNPDLFEIANTLAELENRSAANAIETLVKEAGPTKIVRLRDEKKALNNDERVE